MALSSQISGIVARQVGSIQGKVTAQVQSRVLQMLQKFVNECPTGRELPQIIKERSNLLSIINSFESRITTVGGIANKFNAPITTLRTAITVIKNITIPTAIIPGQIGGVGIPINILTRYSDALIQLNKLVDHLESEKNAVVTITSTASDTLTNLKARLEALDAAIEECSKSSPNLPGIVNQAQPKANTGSEGTPKDPDYYYKGYKLAVIEDKNSPSIAPKRYAIAKDRIGAVILQGPSSFSSDTKVLLDEIKFRIDNQLA